MIALWNLYRRIMTPSEMRFGASSLLYAAPLIALLELMPDGAPPGFRWLKYGFVLPITALTIDMWLHFTEYHDAGKYGYTPLRFLADCCLLVLLYCGVKQLDLPDNLATKYIYPPNAFWAIMAPYAILKTIRCWNLVIPYSDPRTITWYSLLHLMVFVGIVIGCLWSNGYILRGYPLYLSSIVFSVIASVYCFAVYVLSWNPLKAAF